MNDVEQRVVMIMDFKLINAERMDKLRDMYEKQGQVLQRLSLRLKKMSNEWADAGIKSKFLKQNEQYQTLRNSMLQVSGSMQHIKNNMNKLSSENRVWNNQLRRMGYNLNGTKKEAKWFRMELLGIMFLGMGMQRFFGGLLQPAAEVFGIFDLWNTLLMVFFLPVMEDLFAIFMKIFDAFMAAPEWFKKLVGWFVVLGLTIGVGLKIFGMFGSGWASFAKAFPGIAKVIVDNISKLGTAIMNNKLAFAGWAIGISAMIWTYSKMKQKFGDRWLIEWAYAAATAIAMLLDTALYPFMKGFQLLAKGYIAIKQAMDSSYVPGDYLYNFANAGLGISGLSTIIATAWDKSREEAKEEQRRMEEDAKNHVDNTDTLVIAGWTDINDNMGEELEKFRSSLKDTYDANLKETDTYVRLMDSKLSGSKSSSSSSKYKSISDAGKKGGTAAAREYASIDRGKGSYEVTDKSGKKIKRFYDMIWRPGSPPVAIDPNDTLVATKGGKGVGGGVNISYTINGGLSGKEEVERMIRNANSKLVSDIQRLVGA